MQQRTLLKSVSAVGIGLHSGDTVTLTLNPDSENNGIKFVRTDVENAPIIKADAFLVTDTLMSSNLEVDGIKVGTVEHLLSAVAGLGIDNLTVEVSSPEIPIMDGSAVQYVDLLLKAGITEQASPKKFLRVLNEVRVQQEDKWATLSPYAGYQLDFEIDFNHPAIPVDTQHYNFEFSTQNFMDHISQARTFGFMRDIEYLKQQNLAKGGSLDNAIVLDDNGLMNETGLRYKDEFVRHKILDALGDLYLASYPLLAKFNAYKSGHDLNNKLVRKLLSNENNFEIVTFYDNVNSSVDYSL